jgi:hypothetical protein
MSWAAGRETTRVEDIAYSLMGIFNVNMPLLYGEGKNAFLRLQHEIISKSDDESIFAWRDSDLPGFPPTLAHPGVTRGILAQSPGDFRRSNRVQRMLGSEFVFNVQIGHAPYSMTNKGLHIELPLIPCNHPKLFVAQLNCHIAWKPVTIVLQGSKGEQFARCCPAIFGMELGTAPGYVSAKAEAAQHTPIFVKEDIPDHLNKLNAVRIFTTVSRSTGYEAQYTTLKTNHSTTLWEPISGTTSLRMTGYHTPRMGTIVLKGGHNTDMWAIACGFRGRALWVEVVRDFEKERVEEIIASYDLHPWNPDPKYSFSQYLDRSSAVLPSGWTVTASSLMTHPVEFGDPPAWCYEINIKFERTTFQSEERVWMGTYGEFLVNPPVRQSGYRVITEDLRDTEYHGQWLKHKDAKIYRSAPLSTGSHMFCQLGKLMVTQRPT